MEWIKAFIIPMVLMVLLAVYIQFAGGVNRGGWTTAQNETFNAVDEGASNGFDLAAMLPYAIIGLTILALMLKAFGVF